MQHVVVPHAEGSYVTAVRVHASIRSGDAPAWMVLPFPNKDRQWDVGRVDDRDVVEVLGESGMLVSAEPCEWRPPPVVVIASDFAALIRDVRWDIMPNTTSSFDTDMSRIRKSYPECGFVAFAMPRSGGFEVTWRWRGDQPFAATAWLDKERAPEVQVVKMRDVASVAWATPGLDQTAPTPAVAWTTGVEVEVRPSGRNSDVVGVVKHAKKAAPACAVM